MQRLSLSIDCSPFYRTCGWRKTTRQAKPTQGRALRQADSRGTFASHPEAPPLPQATQTCRAHSFAGIWASSNGRFNLSTKPAKDNIIDDYRSAMSWFAASGRNIGGPDALTPHPSLAEAPYEYKSSVAKLQNISIAAAKPF